MMLRAFVVDDSQFSRKAIARVISTLAGVSVVGTASSGREAIARIAELKPDLVTLDVEMPDLDGLATLRCLLETAPELRVIMVSSHTRKGAEATLEALSIGAVDFIDKSGLNLMDFERLSALLSEKITIWDPTHGDVGTTPRLPDTPSVRPAGKTQRMAGEQTDLPIAIDFDSYDICVIGASTGGPPAVEAIVTALPKGFPVPIVVVQHMPMGFTAPFAARLDRISAVTVAEVPDGGRLEGGRVYVARAGSQLRVDKDLHALLSQEKDTQSHIPSVDVTMLSAAEARGDRVIGVLLTGMGNDGALGLQRIRLNGGLTIAESQETSVIFGMPRAAIAIGGACHVLGLQEIVAALAGTHGVTPETNAADGECAKHRSASRIRE